MNWNEDGLDEFEKKVITVMYICVIVICVFIIVHIANSIIESDNANKTQSYNSYVETANVTDMTTAYDNDGNLIYEMKAKIISDNKEIIIVINQKQFLQYRIGDAVRIKDEKYLYE